LDEAYERIAGRDEINLPDSAIPRSSRVLLGLEQDSRIADPFLPEQKKILTKKFRHGS